MARISGWILFSSIVALLAAGFLIHPATISGERRAERMFRDYQIEQWKANR